MLLGMVAIAVRSTYRNLVRLDDKKRYSLVGATSIASRDNQCVADLDVTTNSGVKLHSSIRYTCMSYQFSAD